MKKLNFEKGEFIQSALSSSLFPLFKNDRKEPYSEIVIVGKSNVGKSSLINHLLNQKKLAYVSSKPGKTKTINFFKIDNKVILIDFPGYGFARQSQKLKKQWVKNCDIFLNERENIKLLLLLIDIRRDLEDKDIIFYKWAEGRSIPCALILTKADKLKKKEIEKKLLSLQQHLQEISSTPPLFYQNYSIKEPSGKKMLIAQIKRLLGEP